MRYARAQEQEAEEEEEEEEFVGTPCSLEGRLIAIWL